MRTLAAGAYLIPEALPLAVGELAEAQGMGEMKDRDWPVPASEEVAAPTPKKKRKYTRRAKGPAPENVAFGPAPENKSFLD